MGTPIVNVVRGEGPLVISIPHLGTAIPEELRASYTPAAASLQDTDWHLDRLYDGAVPPDATIITANISRYVIDLNRPATDESLYPGLVTTTLCPLETFHGEMVYEAGHEPDASEIARRIEAYWNPYHRAIKAEILRLRGMHGNVVLWDAHSIASVIPRLFAGKLPDYNFGTAEGESCHPDVLQAAVDAVRFSSSSWVVNGRFKGGYITRKYGQPNAGIHAIQLEICQSLYMDEIHPFEWNPERAARIRPTLRAAVMSAVGRAAR